MESEVLAAAIIGGYWQAAIVVVAVVALAVGAFSLISFWASRHIDAKFDKHAAAIDTKFAAMDTKFDQYAAAIDTKFAAMDTKFDQYAAAMDAKFDQHTAAMDAKFDQYASAMDTKFDQHASAMDAKFDKHTAVMDAKFDQQAAVMDAHQKEVESAIARGTREHEDWRVEMKAINEKLTDLVIDREVERRMQASRGESADAAESGGV